MNKVILMGNLTRDPEIRYTQSENSMAIARFSLAVNRRFARQGDTDVDFFNCTAFGRQAEFVEKVYSVQIIAEESEFAERKSTADANASAFQAGGAPQPTAAKADDDFMDLPTGIEDGLPFN